MVTKHYWIYINISYWKRKRKRFSFAKELSYANNKQRKNLEVQRVEKKRNEIRLTLTRTVSSQWNLILPRRKELNSFAADSSSPVFISFELKGMQLKWLGMENVDINICHRIIFIQSHITNLGFCLNKILLSTLEVDNGESIYWII